MVEIYNCTKEGTLARHETQINQLIKSVDNLDKIYDLIYGITTNVSVMTSTMVSVTEDIDHIKKDIKEIKSKDGQDFVHYKRAVIVFLIISILGFIITSLKLS